jgi:HD-GYP domain-containing protein (c-di-GMP phosphodiesterase class II)
VAALAEIEANTGTQFCPRVVAALRTIWRNNPHLLAREQPPQRDAA